MWGTEDADDDIVDGASVMTFPRGGRYYFAVVEGVAFGLVDVF